MFITGYSVVVFRACDGLVNTTETHPSAEAAKARAAEWQRAGYSARACETRINLDTLEVTTTTL